MSHRLGFAVKVLGRPAIKANDSRRWQSSPHLARSLRYLDRIFDILAVENIRMYRISSDIAPYMTHPDLPRFHRQIDACLPEIAALGARARRLGLRLSMHPSQYVVLNSPDERIAASAAAEFAYHARFLDCLGGDRDAVIVTHAGGVYGDRAAAADRFCRNYEALPEDVRQRLVLENDEISWSVDDILPIHERVGIPLVFDILHHEVNPGERGLEPVEALRLCLATWRAGQTPKMHFSSQRRETRQVRRRSRTTGAVTLADAPAKAGQHADWIDPDEFIAFARATDGLAFDVMLEAKQKDLAVLKLRESIVAAGLRGRFW